MEALDLKAMLYLTLIYCFLEIIMIYDKYDFLNVNDPISIDNGSFMSSVIVPNEFL